MEKKIGVVCFGAIIGQQEAMAKLSEMLKGKEYGVLVVSKEDACRILGLSSLEQAEEVFRVLEKTYPKKFVLRPGEPKICETIPLVNEKKRNEFYIPQKIGKVSAMPKGKYRK